MFTLGSRIPPWNSVWFWLSAFCYTCQRSQTCGVEKRFPLIPSRHREEGSRTLVVWSKSEEWGEMRLSVSAVMSVSTVVSPVSVSYPCVALAPLLSCCSNASSLKHKGKKESHAQSSQRMFYLWEIFCIMSKQFLLMCLFWHKSQAGFGLLLDEWLF